MFFENKIALVTGGTSGIGKEIVKELLSQGATVFANYSKNDIAKNQMDSEFNNDRLFFIKCDISKEEQVSKMFQEINEKFGKLDILVNNAGINIDAMIENFQGEDFEKILKVNLIGKFLCTKYAISLLKKGRNSAIVNIASRLGISPCEEASAYCASEAGIINFTKSSALELSKDNIRVNSVSPGLTMTPLALSGWTSEEITKQMEENPLKRLAETKDIANAVLFLLSDKASYITGENINVNGGSLL